MEMLFDAMQWFAVLLFLAIIFVKGKAYYAGNRIAKILKLKK